MKSKLEISNNIPYPKMMSAKTDDKLVVVFFEKECCGQVVYTERDIQATKLGSVDYSWDMTRFQDFTGVITLSN